jgi:hypothetical protein
MIWLWIRNALFAILKLFIPPLPEELPPPEIDANAPCPGCGHRNGQLSIVQRNGKLFVQHDCKVCRAQWWEKPVIASYAEPTTSSTVKLQAPAPPKE